MKTNWPQWSFSQLPYLTAAALVVLAANCGSEGPETGKTSEELAAEVEAANAESEQALADSCHQVPIEPTTSIRLKDVGLLSSSLVNALGAGSTRDLASGENLLEIYAPNFGGADDDRKVASVSDDQIGGNNVRSDYFMALNFVAYNAGLYCEAKNDQEPRCACDTEESARVMLARAIPYQNWCSDDHAALVTEVVDLCQRSQKDLITALFSSVAFAKRN